MVLGRIYRRRVDGEFEDISNEEDVDGKEQEDDGEGLEIEERKVENCDCPAFLLSKYED
ncbi:hypothetical protein A2U01_0018398 [Trifolium medium]|uniref:Uncharacterized protein n=1 Tax=Trifolium medium TaxID=97028 RepID=A0A392NDJ9_9FABA|nr:hypothetical protein [Trifolium medium]